MDEVFHYDQIQRFVRHDWTLNPLLAMTPGYHALVAAVAALGPWTSLPTLRAISFGLSAFSIIAFFLAARQIDEQSSVVRVLHYTCLPILFPFFFLLYTDVVSLLFVLLCFYLMLVRRYWLAGVAGLLATVVRQNAIVWVAFVALFVCVRDGVLQAGWTRVATRAASWSDSSAPRRALSRGGFRAATILFLPAWAFFASVLVWNQGVASVATGDPSAHPFPAVHAENIYFVLFLAGPLFLPIHLANAPKVWRLLKGKRWTWLLLGGFFAAYWITFGYEHFHHYNWNTWFLRNRLLVYFGATEIRRIAFFLVVGYSVLSLAVTELREPAFYLLYPFTALSLLPLWLIEQRYYLIPYALFLLFRERQADAVEWSLAGLYALASAILIHGIAKGMFFL